MCEVFKWVLEQGEWNFFEKKWHNFTNCEWPFDHWCRGAINVSSIINFVGYWRVISCGGVMNWRKSEIDQEIYVKLGFSVVGLEMEVYYTFCIGNWRL
jgi:hypothetical protein